MLVFPCYACGGGELLGGETVHAFQQKRSVYRAAPVNEKEVAFPTGDSPFPLPLVCYETPTVVDASPLHYFLPLFRKVVTSF